MRLFVETMDVVVVGVSDEGQIRIEAEEWRWPTLQERRAIVHAAQNEIAALSEAIDALSSAN